MNGKLSLVLVVAGSAGGLGLGWWAWHPRPAPVETAQPAVRQADQSLLLERKPDAKATAPAIVPKGERLARVVEATVQPTAPFVKPDTVNLPATATEPARTIIKPDTVMCPPVRVDLTMTDLDDGTHRVIASSPDGRVTGGLDIAVTNTAPARVLKNSLGAMRDLLRGTWSVVATHDLAFARVLGEYAPKQGANAAEFKLGLALRF